MELTMYCPPHRVDLIPDYLPIYVCLLLSSEGPSINSGLIEHRLCNQEEQNFFFPSEY